MAKKDLGHAPNADGVCDNCGLEMDSASGKAPCSQAAAAVVSEGEPE
jgi:hypothetical protein